MLSLGLVRKVREEVSRHTRRTPVMKSHWLSSETGAEVFLKCENLQVTGSFKVRGGVAAIFTDRPERVVACSAGNHGVGLAHAARIYDVPCTIVVPESVPKVKEEAIRARGATVRRSPHPGYDDTEAWTREHLQELGGTFISPFDHPSVMAGNGGTLALEIFEEISSLDALVIPCGGGGCSVGAGLVARDHGAKVIGVNSDASPGMWMSRRDGRAHLKVESAPTIAEGIEGGVSENSFRLANEYVDDIVVAKEASIRSTVGEIVRRARMVVEGSGAAGVAALLDGLVKAKRICVVMTGSNIDPGLLKSLL